jgi:hypothetical protein
VFFHPALAHSSVVPERRVFGIQGDGFGVQVDGLIELLGLVRQLPGLLSLFPPAP